MGRPELTMTYQNREREGERGLCNMPGIFSINLMLSTAGYGDMAFRSKTTLCGL